MNNFVKTLFFGFCTALCSCSAYQYVSSPHYVPVNKEKGKINGSVSFNSLQLGYAVSNNFSVYTTGFIRKNNGGIFKQTAFTKENAGAVIQTDAHQYIDIGLTYFKKQGDYLSYEIVSGVGHGTVKYSNFQDLLHNYEFLFEAKRLSFYIQPDISLRYRNYLDLTVFSRVNQNIYYDCNKKLELGDKAEAEKQDKYINDRETASLLFLEPGLQLRAGFEKIKFQVLFSSVFDLKNTGFNYRHGNIHFGFVVQLNLLKK